MFWFITKSQYTALENRVAALEKVYKMSVSRTDLNTALDGQVKAVTDATVAKITPIIADIVAKAVAGAVVPEDFQPELDKLNAVAPGVADAVTAAIAPAAPVVPAA